MRFPQFTCPPPPRTLTCPTLPAPKGAAPRVLLFTKEAPDGFGHPWKSCLAAQNLATCGMARGWSVTITNDAAVFTSANLANLDVVVFTIADGTVFDNDGERAAFKAFIEAGGGFAGIHSASYAEIGWPWFRALVGATFFSHPVLNPDLLIPGSLLIEDTADPIVAGLPNPWVHCEELYSFTSNPANNPNLHLLVSLDENCPPYPQKLRLGHHPLSWRQNYDGGRSFHTALGHHPDAYYDVLFLGHVIAGIEWAGTR